MLKKITIEYIKGIRVKNFELNIQPNKPSLLVAPNGFGKSSLAIAFKSLNNRRIALIDDDIHEGNAGHNPKIEIEYERPDGGIMNLSATSTTNTINGEFDCFVINGLIKPKGIGNQYGSAGATLEISDVVLFDAIPANVQFSYSYRAAQADFGANGKVLPNANSIFGNLKLVEQISKYYLELQRANGQRIQGRITSVIGDINAQFGTTDDILGWIAANRLNELKNVEYLNVIAELINGFDIGYGSETKSYLGAIQLIKLFNQDQNGFKNACLYSNYKLEKQGFEATLSTFNRTWKSIRAVETHGKLVVQFPKAVHISNGERDILCFISMLFKAKKNLKKEANILIIDEVFDYLDDANLITAQYYVTSFIKEYDDQHKRIYPLILTHLNPHYFKNFAFSKQKVYYLDKSTIQINPHIVKLLRHREDASIKQDLDKYLLHFHPGRINKRVEFRALGLKELWGEDNNFIQDMNGEVVKYLNNDPYDPFAVCASLRVKIEEIAYNKLRAADFQQTYLDTHKTRDKLNKAEEMGVISPETHYLLGIIYNEGMHWKEGQDNVSPIASKLENLTIKNLIREVYS